MRNVEIKRTGTDNTMHVLRKFSRRVQSSGLIPHMRKNRYRTRPLSDAKKKQSALHRISKSEERIQLIKEGKMSEAPERGRRKSFRMPRTENKVEDKKVETTETKTEKSESTEEKSE